VNFYSRVQMYLFKAKQAAAAELERACAEHGVTLDQVRALLGKEKRSWAGSLHKAPHAYAGTGADLVAECAPFITKTRAQRLRDRAASFAKRSGDAARKSPHMIVAMIKEAAQAAPHVATRIKEDVVLFREVRRSKKAPPGPVVDAAAE
jgi:hypothetical protein